MLGQKVASAVTQRRAFGGFLRRGRKCSVIHFTQTRIARQACCQGRKHRFKIRRRSFPDLESVPIKDGQADIGEQEGGVKNTNSAINNADALDELVGSWELTLQPGKHIIAFTAATTCDLPNGLCKLLTLVSKETGFGVVVRIERVFGIVDSPQWNPTGSSAGMGKNEVLKTPRNRHLRIFVAEDGQTDLLDGEHFPDGYDDAILARPALRRRGRLYSRFRLWRRLLGNGLGRHGRSRGVRCRRRLTRRRDD